MRKTQLIKWLEEQKTEKKKACREAYDRKKKEASARILRENGTEDAAEKIAEHFQLIGDVLNDWKRGFDDRVENAVYWKSLEVVVADNATYKRVYNTLTQYDCSLANAKKGIEYLTDLGFDVSELEEMDSKKDVSTALATPIDTKYLFLGGEGNS